MRFLDGPNGSAQGAVVSAQEEQSLVAAFFGGEKGFFVEVGAYDPIYQSQSYHLELAGWDGILIEPLPDLAENLARTRRAAVHRCACVAPGQDRSGTVPLVERRGGSTIAFDPKSTADEIVLTVPAATLDEVLEEAGASRVDFLSVDVEGAEPDVLRGLTFPKYKPRLVLVDDRERFGETCSLLRRNGYRLVRRSGHNAWFVPRDARFPVTLEGRLRLAWTYGIGRALRRMRR